MSARIYANQLMQIYDELKKEVEKQEQNELANIAGVGAMALESATNLNYNTNKIYKNSQGGHGIAAERANDMIDNLNPFNDAKILGDDNKANGADRILNGELIQSKYCSSASDSVGEAFEITEIVKDANGKAIKNANGTYQTKTIKTDYRYLDKNGKPMQLEVPSDQYEGAIKAMEKKIKDGRVPGVSDPAEAKNLIKKGSLTYKQAVNINRFGTKESLMFDAAQGAKMGMVSGGISAGISVAQGIYNGDDKKDIAKNATKAGLKATAQTTASSMLSNQAMRHSARKAVENSLSKALQKKLAKKILSNVLKKQVNKKLAKDIAGKVVSGTVTAVATTAVLSAGDIYKSFTGEQSFKQTGKNFVKNGAGVGGGMAGAAAGASIGSVVPVVGTFIGGLIGGAIGAMGASKVADVAMSEWLGIKDDIDEMLEILNSICIKLKQDYKFDSDESQILEIIIKSSNISEITKALYKAKSRDLFCDELIEPVVLEIVEDRYTNLLISPKKFKEAFNG